MTLACKSKALAQQAANMTLFFCLSIVVAATANAGNELFQDWVLSCEVDIVTEQRNCQLATVEEHQEYEAKETVLVVGDTKMASGISLRFAEPDINDLYSKAFLRVDDNTLHTVGNAMSLSNELTIAWLAYVGGLDLTIVPSTQKYLKALKAMGTPEELKARPEQTLAQALASPAFLQQVWIDSGSDFWITEFGVAINGPSAQNLLAEFKAGTRLRVRVVDNAGLEKDWEYSLRGFTAAYNEYLRRTSRTP